MMQIKVNGETRETNPGCSLRELLAELNIEPRHLAIEHNGEFLDESADLAAVKLNENDALEIVRFVGGG